MAAVNVDLAPETGPGGVCGGRAREVVAMLTRARCMVGLHQWKRTTRDGVPYKECRNCDKWKRIVKYGGTHRPFDGGGDAGAGGV